MLATLLLTALVTQATVYRIDPAASEAGFDLKATLHTVHGTASGVAGEVRAVPEDGGALSFSGAIEVAVATLVTGNSRRDAKLHDSSLLVASFPSIVFAPEKFAPASSGATSGTLSGRLTIRGTTRPCAISVALSPQNGRILASGTFEVPWSEFGVPDPSFAFVRVEPVAHAHFRAVLVPNP